MKNQTCVHYSKDGTCGVKPRVRALNHVSIVWVSAPCPCSKDTDWKKCDFKERYQPVTEESL